MRTRTVALVGAIAIAVSGGGWLAVRWIHRSEPSVEQAVRRVGDADPLLLPAKMPAGWKPETHASRSFFTATYRAPGGQTWLRVAIAVPNPPLPDGSTSARSMRFRSDRAASYQASGTLRRLLWTEPGHWRSHVGEQKADAVPYELASEGMTEEQFFAIARSLRSVG